MRAMTWELMESVSVYPVLPAVSDSVHASAGKETATINDAASNALIDDDIFIGCLLDSLN